MDKKISTVCFTGHRDINKKLAPYIPSALKSEIKRLILLGATSFRAGGAMGFDTVSALCVLELKELYPQITLDLVLPCRDQTSGWSEESICAYNYILSKADSVKYITDTYRAGCMHERNRALVEGSDVCVAYLERSSGGSAYTYTYALKNNIEVVNIYDEIAKLSHIACFSDKLQ